MKLTLDSEDEIMRYLNGFKEMDGRHQKLEQLLKSILSELPKRAQLRIQKILEEK